MYKPNPNPTEEEINDFILNPDIACDNNGNYYAYALVKNGKTIEAYKQCHKKRDEVIISLIDAVADELNKEW